MKLWFYKSYTKEKREIADCKNFKEVYEAISKFIEEANKKNIAAGRKPFKRYYTRTWEEHNQTWLDVGSHTEFFIWDSTDWGEKDD